MTKNVPATQAEAPSGAVRESDNALVRALLFFHSITLAAPSMARGFWRYYGKGRVLALGRLLKDYRPHPALYLAVAVAVFGGISFAQTHSVATGVSINGTYVGAVENKEVYQSARATVQAAASRALGAEYDFENETLRAYPVVVANNSTISEDVLVNEICAANSLVSYRYVLTIDGQAVACGSSAEEIESALMAKLNEFTTEDTISAEFAQEINISKQIISDESAERFVALEDLVTATSQQEVIYTIQAGDTWSQIAERYGMTSKELLALNPGFDIDRIWLGQELTVSAAVPLLGVKTVERVAYETTIPYETEYRDDSSLYQGETRVLSAGANGVASVDAHVTYTNGVESNRNVIASTVVTEPISQVVAKGTKERPKTAASGSFSWPTRGRISSTFGGRKSPGGIGSTNHKGLDIANARGTAISAADGGTVTYAGWQSGYGYLVIISHGNGYQTYYAHNSKLLVSVGTKVYKGQQIAKMGSTGNSTGNHCHFEIRLNGTPLNPLKYLP